MVESSNFSAWKKRTNLNLIEDEVMDYIEGSTIQPSKEDASVHAKYMKGKIKAQRILIESIKDSLIPYVSKLKSAKEIYEKLVELFSVSTAGEAISLINCRNWEKSTVMLNALREEWGNFTSGLYGKIEATPFHDLGSM